MMAVPTPLLKSVTTADNGKTYAIEINPGSTFTNGEAVTAKTFVDTWNFAANGGNGQQLGFVFGPASSTSRATTRSPDRRARTARCPGSRPPATPPSR